MGTYLIYALLVSLLNWERLQHLRQSLTPFFKRGLLGWSFYYSSVYPYNIFYMLTLILLFQIYFAATSYIALWFLGEEKRSFYRILGITFTSSLFFVLALFPISLLYSVMPNSVQGDIFKTIYFLSLVGAFGLAGFFTQAFLFIRMCKKVFAQNFGRAFLTWFFPLFIFSSFLYNVLAGKK